jgi:hypothetical protein
MSYTSTASVKTYLGISGAGDDTLIGTLVTRAQAAIDRYCNRVFEAAADTTRSFDAFGPHIYGPTLFVDRDLCAVTTVTNGDAEVLTTTHYVTIPRNDTPYHGLKLKSASGRSWTYTTDWEKAITITGKWAYSTTAPADVVQAADRLAAFYYRQKDAPLQDVTAIEAGVVIKPLALPDDVKALLNPYRRV